MGESQADITYQNMENTVSMILLQLHSKQETHLAL